LADGDVCHSNILGAAGVPTCEDPKGLVLFISVKPCGLWQTGTSATPIFWEQRVYPLDILGAAGVPTCEDPEGLVLFISVKHCGLWQTGTSATPIFWEPQVSPPAKTLRGLFFSFL